MTFQTLDLILLAACPPLFFYGLFRKIVPLQCATALVFFLQLIPLFIGINTPNPDNILIIQVTVP